MAASSHDEQDRKSPTRAKQGDNKLSKWKKVGITMPSLSFLSSRKTYSVVMNFDDGESLMNSIQYLSLLLPDVEDYNDGDHCSRARKRFRGTLTCSPRVVYGDASSQTGRETITSTAMHPQSPHQVKEARHPEDWNLSSMRRESTVLPPTVLPPTMEVFYCSDDVEQNVQDILKIARKLVSAEEFDKAVEVYSILLTNYQSRMQNIPQVKLKKSRFDCDRPLKQWIATMHHNLAVVYNLQGKHQNAVLQALDALKYRNEIRESEKQQKDNTVSTSSTLHVIGSLLELALAHYGAGSFVKSREALSEALRIAYRIFPYESSPMAAIIWNLLGCLQFEEGQLVVALDSFQESLEIQRSLLSNRETLDGIDRIEEYQTPDIDFALLHASTTLCNIGLVHWKRHGPENALSFFEEALILQESVLQDSDSSPPVFIHRLESLIKYLSSVHDQVEPTLDAKFLCDSNDFGCVGSVSSASTYKRSISFVTATRKTSNVDELEAHLCTKGVHYIFHSIHMISLSAPLSVLNATTKSTANLVSGVVSSQQKLKKSMQQSLLYYSRVISDESNGKKNDFPSSFDRPQCFSAEKSKISLADIEACPYDRELLEINFHLIHKFAVRCLEKENYTEAILMYHNILSTSTTLSRKVCVGENYEAISGMALHHLGIIFMYAESYQDAKTVFLKAIELRLESIQRLELKCTSRTPSEEYVTACYALAVSLSSLALTCFLQSEYEDAIIYFSKSLRLFRKMPSSPWIDNHISQVFNNIACINVCIGEVGLRNSLSAIHTAISLCPTDNSQDREVEQIYAKLLVNKGLVELHTHDYGISLISFDEALRRLQCMDTKPSEEIDAIMGCMAYVMACNTSSSDDKEKKKKQLARSYKVMLTNSCDPKSSITLS